MQSQKDVDATPVQCVVMASALPEPYYSQDGITIYNARCEDVLPHLGEFDLLLTDPPYGTQRKGIHDNTRWNDSGGKKAWTSKKWEQIEGDDKPFDPTLMLRFRRAVLWGANYYMDKLPHRRGMLIWDKTGGGKASASFKNDAEIAWTTETNAVKVFRHMWNGYKRDSEIGAHLHPSQKPIALMDWCLEIAGDVSSVVDPFMGSGTTLVACKRRRINAVGIELSEKYCETAANRLAQGVLF